MPKEKHTFLPVPKFKIKFFQGSNLSDLEEQVNEFINKETVVDIEIHDLLDGVHSEFFSASPVFVIIAYFFPKNQKTQKKENF